MSSNPTEKKRPIRVRALAPHNKDCSAIENIRQGSWSNPWSYLSEPIEYRDAIGRKRKNGSYRWLHVRCNCHFCPARLLVREVDLLELLPHG